MSWITTLSGRHFNYLQMLADDIVIEDIATALSNLCRFTGHLDNFYSVAQHSVLCSYQVPRELAFEALMHDASEAYVNDLAAPLKQLLPGYVKLEKQVQKIICMKFGMPLTQSPEVKRADMMLLATERRDFELDDGTPWPCLEGVEPLQAVIHPVNPRQARAAFLERFGELAPGVNFLGGRY